VENRLFLKMPLIHAVGYLRTSSLTNVGEEKDSDKRQRAAITAGARRRGCKVVEWFYEASISGDVAVNERPAFAAMLGRIDGNGVRMVLVESAPTGSPARC
jgi:DNA invertase Pin-like site-specific DNA recombinase